MADHAAGEEEPPVLLERAARATRGKRITKLVEEEVEHDEAFWGQEALKEEDEDDNYQEEQDAGDEFDSDFDEDVDTPFCSFQSVKLIYLFIVLAFVAGLLFARNNFLIACANSTPLQEPQPDEDPEKEVSERLPIKKRLFFPGKTMKKMKAKKKKKNKVIKLEDEGIDDKNPDETGPSKQTDFHDEWESEKTTRKSTRTSVIVRQAEREAIRAEKKATAKPIKKRKEGEEKRMTQEEMLLEAAETEIMNMRNLERVLAREEEVKKKAVVQKAVYEGPTLRFHSRDGESRLEFINGASFGSELSTTSTPYPEKSVCVVTGLPAKYRDPKTGLPYATMAAFKIIRESFLKEEPDKKRPNMSNMGELFESVSGEHSTPKKKRIDARSPISGDLRQGGRFRRIPALDVMDED